MTTLTLVGVATIFGPNVMAVLSPAPGGAGTGASPVAVGGPAGGRSSAPAAPSAAAAPAPGAPGAAAQPGKDPPRPTMLRSASTDGGP
jgi:hypothetical protein